VHRQQAVADHLAGRTTLSDLRHKIRRTANGATRVKRRPGDEAVKWPIKTWPLTVADVCAGGIAGYGKRVADWAKSVVSILS
jgi:hypothetical protein